jgi:hypothetical protein
VQPVQYFFIAEQENLRTLDSEALHIISLGKNLHADAGGGGGRLGRVFLSHRAGVTTRGARKRRVLSQEADVFM